MKTLLLVCFVGLLALTGCRVDPQPHPAPPAHNTDNSHTSENSLDYIGSYESAKKVQKNAIRYIELLNKTAYRVQTANGKNMTGNYSWNNAGTVITLENAEGRNIKLSVGENVLRGVGGGPETGKVFKKKNPLMRR